MTVAKHWTAKYQKKSGKILDEIERSGVEGYGGRGGGRVAMRKGETPGDGSRFRGVHRQSKHKLQLSNV